jgi:hypothetical protein
MTDESLNVDITNINFLDRRIKRINYRRVGKSPPPQVSVKITVRSYEVIRSLAYAEGRRHSPFYEEVEAALDSFVQTKQELIEKQEFLDLAIEDKKLIREENKILRTKLDMLDITTLNDCPVSLEGGSNE